jgi:hypothetical protein
MQATARRNAGRLVICCTSRSLSAKLPLLTATQDGTTLTIPLLLFSTAAVALALSGRGGFLFLEGAFALSSFQSSFVASQVGGERFATHLTGSQNVGRELHVWLLSR